MLWYVTILSFVFPFTQLFRISRYVARSPRVNPFDDQRTRCRRAGAFSSFQLPSHRTGEGVVPVKKIKFPPDVAMRRK